MQITNRFPLLSRTLEVLVVFFMVVLVHINSFVRFRQFPEVDNYSDNEGYYVLAAILTLALMLYLLRENGLLNDYGTAWKNKIVLILFLLYAVLSLFWTVYFPATQYKLLFLFFSCLAGAYIAIRYRMVGVVEVLTWVAAVYTVLSILVIAFFPFVGVMQSRIFYGSWTGIIWHRNPAGNFFAFFNMIFLLRVFLDYEISPNKRIILILLYFLSGAIVFGSKSATGVIIFLFLHLLVFLSVAWLKFHEKIKRWHYYVVGGLLLAGFLVFITNTAFFFGLLGRSGDMTGRLPVWQDLLQRVFMERPFLGYGYGALWMQKSFRIAMQIRHGWSFQPFVADNGFMDILLNMGLIGFVLFLSIYIPFGIRSLIKAVRLKQWFDFLPLLTFFYIFIGNVSHSILLEQDQFVWMILVIMVFLTNDSRSKTIPRS